MQVTEFAKGSRYALGLTIAPPSLEAFAGDLRTVKLALLDWRAKRASGCELVMFTVVSAPELHPEIEGQIERIYRDEVELAPFLGKLTVQVALLDTSGEARKEYRLGGSGVTAR
jgi:hypothetical protein